MKYTKVLISLDEEIHKALITEANDNQITVNQLISDILHKYVLATEIKYFKKELKELQKSHDELTGAQ
jgi:hypothetical protein